MRRAERREVAAEGSEGEMSRTGIWALDGIDGYLINVQWKWWIDVAIVVVETCCGVVLVSPGSSLSGRVTQSANIRQRDL